MGARPRGLEPIVVADGLERTYHVGDQSIRAVHTMDLEVYPGELVAIQGRSGSGKTTLLNLLAGLDTPTTGRVLFQGQDLSHLSEREMTEIRRIENTQGEITTNVVA